VLCVDLDELKEVNHVFGHATGDKLLIEVAHRVQAAARGAFVARLSADEFGLIIDGKQPLAGIVLAERLAEAIAREFQIDGKSVRTGLTTGISVFPHNGADAASLLANAGAALFHAKAKSRGTITLYEPEMDQEIRDRRVLHQDLSVAKRHHRFRGADALAASSARLRAAKRLHSARRRERPDCRDGRMDPARGLPRGRVMAATATDCGQPVAGAVHARRRGRAGACDPAGNRARPGPPRARNHRGALIEDFERGLALLRRLKALGVRISMDDFGSGYSSLSYLQAFPVDKIKVDRTFVINLGLNPQSAAIISAVIDLGHGLEMSIVAEGVETPDQLAFLAAEGCDAVQGYLIGKPLPISQYAALVGRGNPYVMEPVRKTG
jgi:diguanylate cyclase (GGDEF)-like protein